jgi:hypothetical protein
MKRSLPRALALVLLAAGCRSAGPKGAGTVPAGPDPLRPYVGDVRVLRARADEKSITVGAKDRLTGDCDMAVRVRAAGFEKRGAMLSLETVGRPAVSGKEPHCRTVQPTIQLLVAGVSAASTDVAARVDAVLQTPEEYLRAKGVSFDRPADAAAIKDVASPDVLAAAPEAGLGRKVKEWPKVLLSVNPYVRDASGRLRQESEVEFDAVVGTDGRVHDPKIKTTLSQAHQDVVLSALSRWRYEPARTADAPVAARVSSRLALRIY